MGYNPENPGLITKTGLENGRQPSIASRKTCVLPDREDYYLLAPGQVQAVAGNCVDYSVRMMTRILEAPQQNYKAKELLIARWIYCKPLEGKYSEHGSTRRARRAASRSSHSAERWAFAEFYVCATDSRSRRDWCGAGGAEFVCLRHGVLTSSGFWRDFFVNAQKWREKSSVF